MITEDNLVIQIDTVIYFQVTDPKAASYEIADYIAAIGAHGDHAAQRLRRHDPRGHAHVARQGERGAAPRARRRDRAGHPRQLVELKAVDPPASIQEAMEKQMPSATAARRSSPRRASSSRRSSQRRARSRAPSSVPRASARRRSCRPRASRRRSRRSSRRSTAATPTLLLAYQYLQVLPQIAQGESNKVRIIPSEVTQALGNLGALIPKPDKQAASALVPGSEEVLRRTYEALGRRDFAALDELADPDFEMDLTERVSSTRRSTTAPRGCCGSGGGRRAVGVDGHRRRARDRARRRGARGADGDADRPGSGVEMESRIAQRWTLRDGKLRMKLYGDADAAGGGVRLAVVAGRHHPAGSTIRIVVRTGGAGAVHDPARNRVGLVAAVTVSAPSMSISSVPSSTRKNSSSTSCLCQCGSRPRSPRADDRVVDLGERLVEPGLDGGGLRVEVDVGEGIELDVEVDVVGHSAPR